MISKGEFCTELKKAIRNCLFSLLTQVQCFDYFTIPDDILKLEVIEQMPSLADESYQRSLGTEIFLVFLQMFGKMRNPVGEQSNLTLSTSRVNL